MDALTIAKLSVGPMDNNAYLLTCRSSGEALLIDAANEAERLMDLVGHGPDRADLGAADLGTIVTTHQHGDHWQASPRWPVPPVRGPLRGASRRVAGRGLRSVQ